MLKEYLYPYRKECILGPLFKFLEAVFELLLPLVMARMIEAGVGRREGSTASKWCLLLFLLIGCGFFFSFLCQSMAARASQGVGTKLRERFLEKINRLPLERLEQEGSQHLLTLLTTDINKIQVLIAFAIRLLSRTPFLCIGAVALSFTVHAQLAWVLFALLPLLAGILYGVSRIAMPHYSRGQEALERGIRMLSETLTGLRVIRSFRATERQRERMEETNALQHQSACKSAIVSGSLGVWTLILLHLAEGLMLWIAGRAIGMDTLSKPALIALLSYINQILVAMMVLANLAQIFPQAFQSCKRLEAFLLLPELLEDPHEACFQQAQLQEAQKNSAGLPLVVSHLSYTYPEASEPALQQIHFELKPGQSLGIIGGTGSGKTTLLRLLQGYGLPQNGFIQIGRQTLSPQNRFYWGQYSSCVPQNYTVLQGTLEEFLLVGEVVRGKEDRDLRIREALQCAQVDFLHWPEDAQVSLASGGRNLSGGQKQRLVLAQALLQPRPFLLLDQACSAMDPQTSKRVRQGIARYISGMNCIHAAQHVDVLRDLDRILVLQEGRQVGFGTHAELLQACPEYRDLCRLQLGEEALLCN